MTTQQNRNNPTRQDPVDAVVNAILNATQPASQKFQAETGSDLSAGAQLLLFILEARREAAEEYSTKRQADSDAARAKYEADHAQWEAHVVKARADRDSALTTLQAAAKAGAGVAEATESYTAAIRRVRELEQKEPQEPEPQRTYDLGSTIFGIRLPDSAQPRGESAEYLGWFVEVFGVHPAKALDLMNEAIAELVQAEKAFIVKTNAGSSNVVRVERDPVTGKTKEELDRTRSRRWEAGEYLMLPKNYYARQMGRQGNSPMAQAFRKRMEQFQSRFGAK